MSGAVSGTASMFLSPMSVFLSFFVSFFRVSVCVYICAGDLLVQSSVTLTSRTEQTHISPSHVVTTSLSHIHTYRSMLCSSDVWKISFFPLYSRGKRFFPSTWQCIPCFLLLTSSQTNLAYYSLSSPWIHMLTEQLLLTNMNPNKTESLVWFRDYYCSSSILAAFLCFQSIFGELTHRIEWADDLGKREQSLKVVWEEDEEIAVGSSGQTQVKTGETGDHILDLKPYIELEKNRDWQQLNIDRHCGNERRSTHSLLPA